MKSQLTFIFIFSLIFQICTPTAAYLWIYSYVFLFALSYQKKHIPSLFLSFFLSFLFSVFLYKKSQNFFF